MAYSSTLDAADARQNPQLKYVVAVRALCEFTAKQGDLDMRFTPSPSAEEGVAGHRVLGGVAHRLTEATDAIRPCAVRVRAAQIMLRTDVGQALAPQEDGKYEEAAASN